MDKHEGCGSAGKRTERAFYHLLGELGLKILICNVAERIRMQERHQKTRQQEIVEIRWTEAERDTTLKSSMKKRMDVTYKGQSSRH